MASLALEAVGTGSKPTIYGGAPLTLRSDAPDLAPRRKSPTLSLPHLTLHPPFYELPFQ